jgi:dissimilatory sulfite reductase (desulfoviridin) alpha/beta subunit
MGGKHGKHPSAAYEIAQFIYDEECLSLIEKTTEWYRANGDGRERIGNTIVRRGLARYLAEVVTPLGLEVVERPEERRKFRTGGNLYT